jgi:hypothetical protein
LFLCWFVLCLLLLLLAKALAHKLVNTEQAMVSRLLCCSVMFVFVLVCAVPVAAAAGQGPGTQPVQHRAGHGEVREDLRMLFLAAAAIAFSKRLD